LILGAIFVESKEHIAILQKFTYILPKFLQILPGFSLNQNLWGEALRTCCSGCLTATVAQRIQVVSILLHEAQPELGLFCFHLNTIE